MTQLLFFFSIVIFIFPTAKSSPLNPVRLDSPRATMKTYLQAMDDYNKGRKLSDQSFQNRISDAVRTLDLSEVPPVIRHEKGRELAILLKEVLDRVIEVDLNKIPDDNSLSKWRLKDTEITIRKAKTGDSEGDYLFSRETVARIPEFYKKVHELPFISPHLHGAGYQRPFQERWLPEWAQENFLGLKKAQWIGILLAVIIGMLIKTVTQFTLGRLVSLTGGDGELTLKHQILHSVERPVGLILASLFWYFSIHLLKFEGIALTLLVSTIQVIFSIGLIWAAYRLTDVLTVFFERLAQNTESELDDQLVPLFAKSLRVFVVVIGILVTVQNLGFNVMSLLAGLGLGGLAFALAAKDTAANVFGSIMILLDRPFRVGDWIVTSKAEGTVEEVGFRSTRLRTFYSSVVSIPNSIIANENIDNMGQRQFRRVKTILGLTYSTPPEKMASFVEGVKKIILEHPDTRKDYFHVYFNEYGNFSLNVLVYFFLDVPDWASELKGKEEIYSQILTLAKNVGVEFAFPTQTLHVESLPEKPC